VEAEADILTHYKHSLLTAHCSLLTAHSSLLTPHCSLLTAHYLLLTCADSAFSRCNSRASPSSSLKAFSPAGIAMSLANAPTGGIASSGLLRLCAARRARWRRVGTYLVVESGE